MASNSESVLPPSDSNMSLTHASSVLLRRLQTMQAKTDSDEQIQLRTANEHLSDLVLHYRAAFFCATKSADANVDPKERQQYKALGEAYGRLCKVMSENPSISKPQDWRVTHQHLTSLDKANVTNVDKQTGIQKAANEKIAKALRGPRPKGEVLSGAVEDVELNRVMEFVMGIQLAREQAEAAEEEDDNDFMYNMDREFAERTGKITGSSKRLRTDVVRDSVPGPVAGGSEETTEDEDHFGEGFDE